MTNFLHKWVGNLVYKDTFKTSLKNALLSFISHKFEKVFKVLVILNIMAKKKFMIFALFLLIISLILIPQIQAAKVYGNVYGPDLELLTKAIIEVNSIPKQAVVTSDGYYAFNLDLGNYTIEAFYSSQGILLYTKENINITKDGEYVKDIILFEMEDIEDIEFDESDLQIIEELLDEKKINVWVIVFGIIIILVIVGISIAYLFYKYKKIKRKSKKKIRKKKIKRKKTKVEKLTGDELFNKVLAYIKKERRATQKDLRKKFNVSEAKMSLILVDLENKGIVQKIKRGRGNIIIYRG